MDSHSVEVMMAGAVVVSMTELARAMQISVLAQRFDEGDNF
jgi:hypothetical protein